MLEHGEAFMARQFGLLQAATRPSRAQGAVHTP
jgi:hypothetical protein